MTKRAILFSIKPPYVSLIESGLKRFELRRQRPNISTGDLALVYESSPTKSLVGAFFVGEILSEEPNVLWEIVGHESGITKDDFLDYFEGCEVGCSIQIKQYWSLAERICINEMRTKHKIRPPQSYRFLNKAETSNLMGKFKNNLSA